MKAGRRDRRHEHGHGSFDRRTIVRGDKKTDQEKEKLNSITRKRGTWDSFFRGLMTNSHELSGGTDQTESRSSPTVMEVRLAVTLYDHSHAFPCKSCLLLSECTFDERDHRPHQNKGLDFVSCIGLACSKRGDVNAAAKS